MPIKTQYERVVPCMGIEAFGRLQKTRIIIFGVGGVGSWCAESLIRSGVSHLTIVDFDVVSESNINRQAPASYLTLSRPKAEVIREHLLTLNPNAHITTLCEEVNADNVNNFHLEEYDFIIDAIDSVLAKTALLLAASNTDATVFSSMGAAGKMDISKIAVAEFWKVNGCSLAAALRQRMKKTQTFPAKKILCVFSPENRNYAPKGAKPTMQAERDKSSTQAKGSLMHITASFGLMLTQLVITNIINK